MRKLIALSLILALIASPVAAKGKKKKKGPAPYKSENVNVIVPHPIFYTTTGEVLNITGQEFMNQCAVPASNGLDGYVFEVPEDYRKITSSVKAIGTPGGPASYDLDMILFDESCEITFAFQAVGTDETGLASPGTAWVLVYNYLGDPNLALHLEMTPASI